MAPRVQALGVAAKAVLEARARPGDEPVGGHRDVADDDGHDDAGPRGVRTHRGNIDQVAILAPFKASQGEAVVSWERHGRGAQPWADPEADALTR